MPPSPNIGVTCPPCPIWIDAPGLSVCLCLSASSHLSWASLSAAVLFICFFRSFVVAQWINVANSASLCRVLASICVCVCITNVSVPWVCRQRWLRSRAFIETLTYVRSAFEFCYVATEADLGTFRRLHKKEPHRPENVGHFLSYEGLSLSGALQQLEVCLVQHDIFSFIYKKSFRIQKAIFQIGC